MVAHPATALRGLTPGNPHPIPIPIPAVHFHPAAHRTPTPGCQGTAPLPRSVRGAVRPAVYKLSNGPHRLSHRLSHLPAHRPRPPVGDASRRRVGEAGDSARAASGVRVCVSVSVRSCVCAAFVRAAFVVSAQVSGAVPRHPPSMSEAPCRPAPRVSPPRRIPDIARPRHTAQYIRGGGCAGRRRLPYLPP